MDILEHLLNAPPLREPVTNVSSWFDRLASCPFERSTDRALWAGFAADRLGYAFAGGYQAALARLFTSAAGALGDPEYTWPSRGTRLSLAATESGGAHPRAIETKLVSDGGTTFLRGEKTFATLASLADELLVVASCGVEVDGRKPLRLVRVRTSAPGVTIEDRRPTPFAPEIPHAKVKLDVVVEGDDLLPGDGYAVYLKPFRTIEDTHVLAAALGHIVATARIYDFATAVSEEAVALAAALGELTDRAPLDPVGHIALSGLFSALRRLLGEHASEWNKADTETRERWTRDQGLLLVAEGARQQRTAAAWKALASRSTTR